MSDLKNIADRTDGCERGEFLAALREYIFMNPVIQDGTWYTYSYNIKFSGHGDMQFCNESLTLSTPDTKTYEDGLAEGRRQAEEMRQKGIVISDWVNGIHLTWPQYQANHEKCLEFIREWAEEITDRDVTREIINEQAQELLKELTIVK